MLSNNHLSRDEPNLTVATARNHSDSSSFTDFQEKTEAEPAQVAENESVEKDEHVTAYLQVLGAFFLMFNSW